METFKSASLSLHLEKPASATTEVASSSDALGPTFESLFEAAKSEPVNPENATYQPTLQMPVGVPSAAQLIYSLTGGYSMPARPQAPAPLTMPTAAPQQPAVAAQQAPAMAAPSELWERRVPAQPIIAGGGNRMDALRNQLQKFTAPQNTLDIKVTLGNNKEVRTAPKAAPLGKVSPSSVSEKLQTFRNGDISWSDLQSWCGRASERLEKVAHRLSVRGEHLSAMATAVQDLGIAVGNMRDAAIKLDSAALDAAETQAIEADVALSTARR